MSAYGRQKMYNTTNLCIHRLCGLQQPALSANKQCLKINSKKIVARWKIPLSDLLIYIDERYVPPSDTSVFL